MKWRQKSEEENYPEKKQCDDVAVVAVVVSPQENVYLQVPTARDGWLEEEKIFLV